MVIVDQAVIYSDQDMSSTVGFIRKGKIIKVGEVARNKSQVFPIVISGKVAYIRVEDVSTEYEDPDSQVKELERFRQQTLKEYKTKYSLSFISYLTKVTMSGKGNRNGIQDKDSFNFIGVGGKGEAYLKYNLDVQFLVNFLAGTGDRETFRYVEGGLGAGFRIINFSRFKVSVEGQILGIPYASYSYQDKFRVNGFGFTAGGGGTAAFRLGESFGLEGSAGVYYTKLGGFKTPKQFESIVPGFIGTRIYAGVNYTY